jgi:hypothetical protein
MFIRMLVWGMLNLRNRIEDMAGLHIRHCRIWLGYVNVCTSEARAGVCGRDLVL